MKYLFLLSLFFACCGLSGLISEGSVVTRSVGDDVILLCRLNESLPNDNGLVVEWKRNETRVHTYRSKKDYTRDQDEWFKNRTGLFHSEMLNGNMSLKLFNVTEQDEGVYTCYVSIGKRLVKEENITLKIVLKEKEEEIKDDPKNHLSTPAIIGIVVVFALIAFIVIGIGIVVKCQRGQQQNNGIV